MTPTNDYGRVPNQCQTCRHWLPIASVDDPEYEMPQLLDDDGAPLYSDEDYNPLIAAGQWGFCQRVAELGPRKASRFYVIDGSNYMAKLGTRSDFGCVEHEPTDAT